MSDPNAPKTSGLAIAALVCVFLCMPLGLILGIVALVQIGKSNGQQGGKGLALAAVIISGLMIPMSGILAAIAIPNFVRYQLRSKSAEARVNLAMLRTTQEARYADWQRYLKAEPAGNTPSQARAAFSPGSCNPACGRESPEACTSFACLDFDPGQTYFRYACDVNADGSAFTCAALGDLNGDGAFSLWAVAGGDGDPPPVPDFSGRSPPCAGLVKDQVVDCTPGTY